MLPPSHPPAAVLFDMDGTLVDNMSYHVQAWVALARTLGLDEHRAPAERFEREFAGKRNEEILAALLGRALPPEEAQRLADEKEAHYRALYAPHRVALRGAPELLGRLRDAGRPLAVSTAAPQANRDFVLGGLHLRPFFSCVVGAEDVARGKPFPDIFLATARALGVEPAGCVVFEDAINGILAARAAGMFAVGVTTLVPEAALREAGAHWVTRDFASLPEALEHWLLRRG